MKDVKIPMVLFGIIAVVAVVGMVLMFVQENNTAGMSAVGPFSNQPGWYTNYDQSNYPYWATVQPPNIPAGSISPNSDSKIPGPWYGVVNTQRMDRFEPQGIKRNPEGNIPAPLQSCGRGYAKFSWQESRGKMDSPNWDCKEINVWDKKTGKGGFACCALVRPMVDHYMNDNTQSLA
jgi:hypothetical protein